MEGLGELLGQLTASGKQNNDCFRSNIQLNRGSKYSAGYDILSTGHVVIAPGRLVQIPTGLIINITKGFVFVLHTKSRHTINRGMMNMEDGISVPYSELKQKYSPKELLAMMEKNRVFSDHSVTVEGGIIDADYHEPIFVSLFNHSQTEPFVVAPGDAIAQGIILEHHTFANDNFSKEPRTGGFGSTN